MTCALPRWPSTRVIVAEHCRLIPLYHTSRLPWQWRRAETLVARVVHEPRAGGLQREVVRPHSPRALPAHAPPRTHVTTRRSHTGLDPNPNPNPNPILVTSVTLVSIVTMAVSSVA